MISVEMIFGSFLEGIECLIYSCEKKTFTVEMIISKKVGNHFLLGNGSQPPMFVCMHSFDQKTFDLPDRCTSFSCIRCLFQPTLKICRISKKIQIFNYLGT